MSYSLTSVKLGDNIDNHAPDLTGGALIVNLGKGC
jgi:hypothetical protein